MRAEFTDVVWNEPKQVALIDSIFRNYYIPPIVFAVQRDDDGEEIRVCVDGKQVCKVWCNHCVSLANRVPAPYIYTEVHGWSSALKYCLLPF